MHVFIDESGSFTGFHAGSISVVGALAIPDGKLEILANMFARSEDDCPLRKAK
jgi:hypothetical protein